MASHPIRVTAREAGDDVVVEVRTLALLGSEDKQLDAYISGRSYSGFEESYRWIVAGDGTLTLHHKVNPQGSMPAWLPRMGLTLMLDKSLDQVEWHGRGPQASYPDRKSGYRLGIWHTDVASMYERRTSRCRSCPTLSICRNRTGIPPFALSVGNGYL